MSDFFIPLFFALILLHAFSAQAMIKANETTPLLKDNISIQFQTAEDNTKHSDYLLTVFYKGGSRQPTQWLLSNILKNEHYLKPIEEPTLENKKTQGTPPRPQEQLIKNQSTIDTFLVLTSHQEFTLTQNWPSANPTTYQSINQSGSVPTKTALDESEITHSLNYLKELIENDWGKNAPTDFTRKEQTWGDFFKHYCCLEMLSKVFGHSDTSKPPNNYINEFYDGT